MGESVKDSVYHSLQHFISNAPWDARAVMNQVSKEVNTLLQEEKTPIGLLIDESGSGKKGENSVGVTKQYYGTNGKLENCQVQFMGLTVQGNIMDWWIANCLCLNHGQKMKRGVRRQEFRRKG